MPVAGIAPASTVRRATGPAGRVRAVGGVVVVVVVVVVVRSEPEPPLSPVVGAAGALSGTVAVGPPSEPESPLPEPDSEPL